MPSGHGISSSLVITGQHPEPEPTDFALGGFSPIRLHCCGEVVPHAHVRAVTAALLPHLRSPPDLLVVQGDTPSAPGAALAAFTAGVPIAHVEAGPRTHDPGLPCPDEEYRTAIDARGDLLFAPTEISEANLRAEQLRGAIHVTGNTGIDATLLKIADLPPPVLRDGRAPKLLVTCRRRESWGDGLESIAAALTELTKSARVEMILHPNAFVANKMKHLLGAARRT